MTPMKPILTLEQLSSLTLPQRLAVFVGWLGEQKPDTPYRFSDSKNCAVCQFAKSACGIDAHSGGGYIRDGNDPLDKSVMIVEETTSSGNNTPCDALIISKTFGELHDHLKKFVPEPPILPSSLTEGERLDLIERRPLVGLGSNILINGGAETSTPKPIIKSE